jgi:hypothetical protein
VIKCAKLLLVVSVSAFGLVACGGSPAQAQAPSGASAESSADPAQGPRQDPPLRTTLTADACEASGGTIVGDIGDGAIHRPEYRCPNGAKPSGSIRAPEAGAIAVEGSVCCPR